MPSNCRRTVASTSGEVKVFGRTLKKTAVACLRKATIYYRATLRYPNTRHRKQGYSVTLGFCAECASGLEDPKNWRRDRDVPGGIRGLPWEATVSAVDLTDALAAPTDSPAVNNVKTQIKKLMRQRNTEKLDLDDWRQIFDDLLREVPVEEVMDS